MASAHPHTEVEAPPAGMLIERDVPITMEDGLVLRADVFRPNDAGVHPVIMTQGVYGKQLAWQEGFSYMWDIFTREHPDALAGSSNRYQVWETVDPEKWVPDGYACVRVDARGAGRSPGYLDMFSPHLASSGLARSRGATVRLACSASLTTRPPSGSSRRSSRRTWPRSVPGRARRTTTAMLRGRGASSTPSSPIGQCKASSGCSTASVSADSAVRRPAS
jgi:hypothetical protein